MSLTSNESAANINQTVVSTNYCVQCLWECFYSSNNRAVYSMFGTVHLDQSLHVLVHT